VNNLLIKRPVISEKSFNLAASGVYSFLVDLKSKKKQIAREVEELFKVDVVSVNIINIPGKLKRVKKNFGRRSDIKKALVKIKKGQKISIFEVEDGNKEKSPKEDKVRTSKTNKPKTDKVKDRVVEEKDAN
jgi:large subunit ribosomal protein L23